ncbi:peptide-N(4)-(N-acetyl-beta-glucosaminyl)asparagine amidase-like [Xenia sp. Carnegie-2017]|uniref:peptide-N(4)-(N-acetyl-beta- glucosaminyl)asparagine amidase-like n=1 Tax=Xenia sp. Carnegie-2017 TaxID=2897299 RepID=UPI001F04EE3D|nr:peptide-N(4)-(N-acetyl-beta-glucosaminyl)asparagine amidase-like [Xenia sp. Carnegie-2017]
MEANEANFFARIMSHFNQVTEYEEPRLQDLYLARIPVVELHTRAEAIRLEKLRTNEKMSSKDCLVLALLVWFKSEFFHGFTRSLRCEKCNEDGVGSGVCEATLEERRWGANRTELYRCPRCAKIMRFPRYNDPEKLLETRRGRCGEWANAFTMCCVALGFKTRYVVDWTDHVWTEVFSDTQERWLHCDPCEGVCDKPLLYEAGWNKQLTYVIAFAKDHIMDVTWRYSNRHDEVLKRRRECREEWLVLTISNFNKSFLDQLSPEMRLVAEVQNIKELVSFLTPQKDVRAEERQGRISGDVEWRRARGELGNSQKVTGTCGFVFKPNEEDIQKGRMRVRYSTAANIYYRCHDDIIPRDDDIKGWENGINSMTSVVRKEEHDWKMVYLAMQESQDSGEITWVIDVGGFEIDMIIVKASYTTFKDGHVNMVIGEDKQEGMSEALDGVHERTVKFSGHPKVKLSGFLRCSNREENSWQHSQLFRQSSSSLMEFPLDIRIEFKSKK